MAAPAFLFVYGTLRPGEKNYPAYLAGGTLREEPASVTGLLCYDAVEGYPYLLPGAGRVAGELMTLDPAAYLPTLDALDALEE